MKLILLDIFRRRWLFLTLFCLAHFIFGLFLLSSSNKDFFSISFFPFIWMLFVLGPNLWLAELRQGYARVTLSLPLTSRQIGRTFWWLCVGIATSLLTVFSCLGGLTARLYSSTNELVFGHWLLCVAMNGVLYGAFFWLYSGAQVRPSNGSQKDLGTRLYGLARLAGVIGGGYLLFTGNLDINIKLAVFFLICVPLTILGWLRAEWMVADYGEYRSGSQQPQNSRKQFTPSSGHGGILFIFQSSFALVWFFGFLMFVGMNVIGIFQKHSFDWHHLTGNINGFFFPYLFIIIFRSMPFMRDLRFLRTMPIPTSRLAAVLLGDAILPLLTFCLAITALAWHETHSVECLSFFKIEFLVAASVSTFIVVSIWNAQKTGVVKSILLATLILSTFAPALYQLTCMDSRGLPFWFVIAFTTIVLAGSYWATCQILAKSSSAYRSRQNMLGNRWNWGR